MKSHTPYFFLITTLLLASSCSSLVSKEDCKKDMSALGFEHGRKGQNKLTEQVRKACINNETTVNLEQYEIGFNKGWDEYCSPIHGYQMGKKGDIYKSYCPPEKEDLYHEKFLIGKKIYEKKDQVNDLEEKIKDLLAAPEQNIAAKDELRRYQEYLLKINREIQTLEQKGMSLIHTPF